MSDVSPIMKWLDELARYFENRDTGGEDRAHWANVYNAENALKVKSALVASEAEVERLREALTELIECCSDCDGSGVVRRLIGPAIEIKCPVCLGARAALTGEKP